MSVDGWRRFLVLGGVASGSFEYAQSLVGDPARCRHLLTSASAGTGGVSDRDGVADHGGVSERIAAARLGDVLAAAAPEETLLVDDLPGWLSALSDELSARTDQAAPADQDGQDGSASADGQTLSVGAALEELTKAIRGCPARLVLLSREVGLAPLTRVSPELPLAELIGLANRAVADCCDATVLVVAGRPIRLAPDTGGLPVPPASTPAGPPVPVPVPAAAQPEGGTSAQQPVPATVAAPSDVVFEPGMSLPMPDNDAAGPEALSRLDTLDVTGSGMGKLGQIVAFAAGTQGNAVPQPWRAVRVLLLHGDHDGGAAAGYNPGESMRRAAQARIGAGPLARLAAAAGADLRVIDTPMAAAIENRPALTEETVDRLLRYGWGLAGEAADSGVDLIVLAACGAGGDAAAAAALTALAGAEPAAVLGRVIAPGGRVDDAAWMTRCAAVRDALHRTRNSVRTALSVLAELGGGELAIATGILLGATARRTPVLLDGPVGVAAAVVSRDFAGQTRHWCLLPDDGGHPGVRFGADVLGLEPLLDLRMDLGEGTRALAALPLLRSALELAATLPAHPSFAPPEQATADEQRATAEEATADEQRATAEEATVGEHGGTEPGERVDEEPQTDAGGPSDARPDPAENAPEFVEPEPEGPGPHSPTSPTA